MLTCGGVMEQELVHGGANFLGFAFVMCGCCWR